ncbi:LuxR family transcriptional regulator [Roseobacter sp. CCS2]|uniref:LuxR family transcriptional regulator n=1 Tax=Roseobacter sp. CCS2 TaxID=391593 RepID=UPI0000F3FBDB|nr:LuxR family transcriptional regulator [Roseobacter sp. CCS2]EBA10900.1 autoinducer-binding transcriptional regulator, LuxR family protein [Roseobacter sp. CCS2]
MTSLVSHLEKLTNARTVEELWDVHSRQMETYGFDRLMYGFTRYRTSTGLGDPQDWVLLSTQSPEYMKVFFDEGLYYHAPMLRWALANNGACSWRWMMDMNRVDNLTASERRVMEFNKSMDVTAGYTVSFRSISERTKGAIALTAKAGMTQDAVEQTWTKHGEEIIVLNNVMHLKLLTLPYSGERNLTKRQREVLQWVGDGKTTQDIALLLGLTPATVEKHLRLAREALDVETTAQAVLKAAFYNQMFVMDQDAI